MKIVIISDIHDNQINLKKTLDWILQNKINRLICCGDVTNSDTIKYLSESFKNNIYLIRGNADNFYDEELSQYDNIEYFGRYGRFIIKKFNVGFCHEPSFFDKVKGLREVNIIFYGHTHKPFIKTENNIQYINPGTLGGMFTQGTFAVWDMEKGSIELKIIDDLKIKKRD